MIRLPDCTDQLGTRSEQGSLDWFHQSCKIRLIIWLICHLEQSNLSHQDISIFCSIKTGFSKMSSEPGHWLCRDFGLLLWSNNPVLVQSGNRAAPSKGAFVASRGRERAKAWIKSMGVQSALICTKTSGLSRSNLAWAQLRVSAAALLKAFV